MKRLQEQKLERQQEQQQISSAPTLPPTDSDFHFASESTVAPPTLSSYNAPQDEHSSPAIDTDFLHLPASSRLPNDLGRPHSGWAEPGGAEPWSTVTTSGVPDPPNLTGANLGWGGMSSANWSNNAAESNDGEERTVNAHCENNNNLGPIELSGEEFPSKRTSQEVEVQYSPISSMDILAEPDKFYFSSSTLNLQPPQPSPHRSSTLSAHTSPQSPMSSSLLQIHETHEHQIPSAVYSHSTAPLPPPVPILEDPVELTPGIVAKAQKHCRFAVSALNYDDVEQARKELRAALALLGG